MIKHAIPKNKIFNRYQILKITYSINTFYIDTASTKKIGDRSPLYS